MEFRTCRRHWGAEFISDDVVRFRVWAEGQKDLTFRLTDTDIPMAAVGDGWFQIDVPGVFYRMEWRCRIRPHARSRLASTARRW